MIPKPAIPPVAKIVISKKSRPKNATTRPKRIASMPKIWGLLTKNYANLVTEKTGHALEFLPSIIGEHISRLFTLGPPIPLFSS